MNQLIRQIRIQANMNQEQFAKELGTTALSINRWENGKTMPNKMAQNQLHDFCKRHNINLFDFIAGQSRMASNDNKLILYHGSKKGIIGDIAPKSREFCDFGRGFYLGTDTSQPLTLICDEKKPKFYTIKMDLTDLKVLNVGIGIEWAMLIAYYRGYMNDVKGSYIYSRYASMAEGYDVIHGYIANDRMYQVMKRFFEKEITDVALINSLSVLDLGEQYVCVTDKACKQLEIISVREFSQLELMFLKERSITRREEGITKTEEVLVKYRREGRYFDEIIRGDL